MASVSSLIKYKHYHLPTSSWDSPQRYNKRGHGKHETRQRLLSLKLTKYRHLRIVGKGGLGVGKGDRRMNKCTVFPSHPRLKQMKKSS